MHVRSVGLVRLQPQKWRVLDTVRVGHAYLLPKSYPPRGREGEGQRETVRSSGRFWDSRHETALFPRGALTLSMRFQPETLASLVYGSKVGAGVGQVAGVRVFPWYPGLRVRELEAGGVKGGGAGAQSGRARLRVLYEQ